MYELKFIIPEIFLSITIFTLLIFGVFKKNSFEIIYRLTILTIFSLILIILTGENQSAKIFSESFVVDKLSSVNYVA